MRRAPFFLWGRLNPAAVSQQSVAARADVYTANARILADAPTIVES